MVYCVIVLVIYSSRSHAGMRLIDEKHVDEVCAANINKFQLQNIGQRNHKSLCALLVGFFSKVIELIFHYFVYMSLSSEAPTT